LSTDARTWAAEFFRWYNYEHHHSAIGLLTPADVHFGRAQTILDQRQQVLHAAYLKNPERFVKGPSIPTQVPTAVWINPPNAQPNGETITVVAVVESVDKWAVLVPSTYPQTACLKGALSTDKYLCNLH
jgi:hypothetical protein